MIVVTKLESGADKILLTRACGEVIEVVTNGHVTVESEQETEPAYEFLFERRARDGSCLDLVDYYRSLHRDCPGSLGGKDCLGD